MLIASLLRTWWLRGEPPRGIGTATAASVVPVRPETLLGIGIGLLVLAGVIVVAAVFQAVFAANRRLAAVVGTALFFVVYRSAQHPSVTTLYAWLGLLIAGGLPVVALISLGRGLLTR